MMNNNNMLSIKRKSSRKKNTAQSRSDSLFTHALNNLKIESLMPYTPPFSYDPQLRQCTGEKIIMERMIG